MTKYPFCLVVPFGWVWVGNQGVFFMNNIPNGLTVIYFDDKDKNIYAELPPDNEQAKKLSKFVYREAMTAISTENKADKPQD